MPPRKRAKTSTHVQSIKHKDKRANIPTEELRDFVADEEATPKTMLYPRDPSLDPQLVWKGKDEQDRQDLAVPVVPIYIQGRKRYRESVCYERNHLWPTESSKSGRSHLRTLNGHWSENTSSRKIRRRIPIGRNEHGKT